MNERNKDTGTVVCRVEEKDFKIRVGSFLWGTDYRNADIYMHL